MYDTQDELLREILAGEDSFIEFKEIIFKGNEIRLAHGEGKATSELGKDLSCMDWGTSIGKSVSFLGI